MSDQAFITYFGTVLCRTGNGSFFHCLIEEAFVPWIYTASRNILVVGNPEDEQTHLMAETGMYLSAQPGGSIDFVKNYDGWEMFRPVSMEEIHSRKSMRFRIIEKNRAFRIPRVIHQVGNSKNIPESFLDNVSRIRDVNPGWDYIYWSEKERHDFIYTYYGWDVLNAYLRINPRYGAARADFFRYLCIYQCGGVYMDMKSRNEIPFDNLIRDDDEYLLSQWNNGPGRQFSGFGLGPEINYIPGGEYQQWHVIATSGHPFLENVITSILARIKNYDEPMYTVGRLGVLRVTGPYVYSASIFPILNEHKHRFFDAEQSGLLYSCVTNHTNTFGRHYSQEFTPVVL
ncbi:glycosyltransferase [Acetobacter sp. AN02]|uniref:glycosyltransferase family 32 protein n=1 Tax=Acetobacter sp. AN02 TaxID=2894186 RepID=UPI0024343B6A|nr:glycosyltransferase [Acetobacter sp. AN02]MDG6095595.1 glycosyltransferase [Acetobacter sp. AN02]